MPTDISWLHYCGGVLFLVACAALVARRGTVLFGLSTVNVFMVASATISGFFSAMVLDQPMDAFTPERVYVVSYSIVGLLAMVAGIAIAWMKTPVVGRASEAGLHFSHAAHINENIGWLTFCVGATAEFIDPFVRGVPTLSTAVHCLSTLARIGLCILLVRAIETKKWDRFAIALGIYQSMSIVVSMASGFSIIRYSTILPLLAIWFVSRGLTVGNVLRACVLVPVTAVVIFTASSAWLETRALIRTGGLAGLPLTQQVSEFFAAYQSNLDAPTGESIMSTTMKRVDMTEILAAQVRHQPEVEPYALGGTLPQAFYNLIPRVLWNDKPVVAGGSDFVTRFSGLYWDDKTSVGLPYPFELYANGGALLVIIGLGVIGYVCARLELKLIGPQKSLGGFWALALATATLTEGGERMDIVGPALVASAVSAYLLGMLVEYWRGPQLTPPQRAKAGTASVPRVLRRPILNSAAGCGSDPDDASTRTALRSGASSR